jgi:acyl-[acyl carrier protein]--UDP-N-acetylglucosamine O-acyltransferase
MLKTMLEEERYRVERLEVQINDMTELEQHEIHNLRQVIKNLYRTGQPAENNVINIREHISNLYVIRLSFKWWRKSRVPVDNNLP